MKKTSIALFVLLSSFSISFCREVAWYHWYAAADPNVTLDIKKTIETPKGLVAVASLNTNGKTIQVRSRPARFAQEEIGPLKENPNAGWHDHLDKCIFDLDEAKGLLDVQIGTEVGYFSKGQLVWDRISGFSLDPNEVGFFYYPRPNFPKKPGFLSTPFYFLKKGFDGAKYTPQPFVFTQCPEKKLTTILREFTLRHQGQEFNWAREPEKCKDAEISSDGQWFIFSQDLNGNGVYVVHGQTHRYFQYAQVFQEAEYLFKLGPKVFFCDAEVAREGTEGGGHWSMKEWSDDEISGTKK